MSRISLLLVFVSWTVLAVPPGDTFDQLMRRFPECHNRLTELTRAGEAIRNGVAIMTEKLDGGADQELSEIYVDAAKPFSEIVSKLWRFARANFEGGSEISPISANVFKQKQMEDAEELFKTSSLTVSLAGISYSLQDEPVYRFRIHGGRQTGDNDFFERLRSAISR